MTTTCTKWSQSATDVSNKQLTWILLLIIDTFTSSKYSPSLECQDMLFYEMLVCGDCQVPRHTCMGRGGYSYVVSLKLMDDTNLMDTPSCIAGADGGGGTPLNIHY